jgi:hypothetical protein
LEKLAKKSIQSTDVVPLSTNELTKLVDKWAQPTKGVNDDK